MTRATILLECKDLVSRGTTLMLLAGVPIGGMARAHTAALAAPATPTAPVAPATRAARPVVAGTPDRLLPVKRKSRELRFGKRDAHRNTTTEILHVVQNDGLRGPDFSSAFCQIAESGRLTVINVLQPSRL